MEKYSVAPKVGPGDALKAAFKDKFVHDLGRSRRSEFWWFFAFYLVVDYLLQVLRAIPAPGIQTFASVAVPLAELYLLVAFVCAFVRRLHDSDHSGYWALAMVAGYFGTLLTPLSPQFYILPIGAFALVIVFGLLDSTKGENDYGDSDKYVEITKEETATTSESDESEIS